MGVIYLLKCREFLKLGFTSRSFETRLQAIRAAIPFQIDVIATRIGTLEEEQDFHVEHKDYRHDLGGREWYLDSPEFRGCCDEFFHH